MDRAFLSLIEEVEAKRAEIRCSRSGAFFRGHNRHEYKLVPSLLRKQLRDDVEHNLYHECFARAGNLVARDATPWERLAFLQHYGIPTRLLDWTESLAVAMFFAFERVSAIPPSIWFLNPSALNMLAIREPGIPHETTEEAFAYCKQAFVFGDVPSVSDFPIGVVPHYFNPRLVAQRACFTIHGANPVPLDYIIYNLSARNLQHVLIKAQFVSESISVLRRIAAQMLPTPSGISPHF